MSAIVWENDGDFNHVATIGQYEIDGQIEYVHGVIHPGYDTRYGWEVIFNHTAAQYDGSMCMYDDVKTLSSIVAKLATVDALVEMGYSKADAKRILKNAAYVIEDEK